MSFGDHLLVSSTIVRRGIAEVFDFFSDPANLARITPPALGFRITTALPIAMRAGTLIDYTIRVAGVRLRWRTRIAEWEPGVQFVDEQLKGPYNKWVHRHSFQSVPEGTLVHDEVRYRLPLFPLGEVAYPLVRRQLDRIFAFRKQQIAHLLS
jgi:ligand-binding SRPBCC domain-containing protein